MNLCQQTTIAPEKILLIGDPTHIPLTKTVDNAIQIVRSGSAAEGIAAIHKAQFDSVLVSVSAIRNHFEQSLSGLRQALRNRRIILLAQMSEEPFVIELMHQRSGQHLFDDYLICPVRIEQLMPERFAENPSIVSDTDKDRRIEELEKLIVQDDLTGLKNRRYLRQFLPQVLSLAGQHNLHVTLLIFDIDDFKHYNDAYGHAVGDNVLQQAGRMIQRCCRSHDVVARLGGDEFAVIFWDLPSGKISGLSDQQSQGDRRIAGLDHPREPIFMTERFCRELSQAAFEFIGPKGKGNLTISGGLATFPTDGTTPEELFEKADNAMLEAKRSGKNRLYLVGQPNGKQ